MEPPRSSRRGMPLVRYRMGDRSRVGEETLKLPDFDEALFPIQGLLNFSVTVSCLGGHESLLVEAQMLTDEDSALEVEQALESLSSKRKIVKCYHNPNEVGSLLKRVIADKRGNNGKSV